MATTGGKAVVLVITGKQAGLFTTGRTVCAGTAGDEAGMQMIHLKCTDGNKDRATGMVDSVNSTTLKVTWSGKLGKESYTKAEGGQLRRDCRRRAWAPDRPDPSLTGPDLYRSTPVGSGGGPRNPWDSAVRWRARHSCRRRGATFGSHSGHTRHGRGA